MRAIRRPPGGPWGDSVVLSQLGVVHACWIGPNLVVDGNGIVTVVWTRRLLGESLVEAVRTQGDGSWSGPQVIRRTTWTVGTPEVTVDGEGRVAVAWHRGRSDPRAAEVEVARYTAGEWTPSARLSDDGEYALSPQVGADADGNLTVVWYRKRRHSDGWPTYDVRTIRRVQGGSWGTPRTLSTGDIEDMDLAVDRGGNVVVAWERRTDAADHPTIVVEAVQRPARAQWVEPRPVSRSHGVNVDIAVDAGGGEIVLAWRQYHRPTNNDRVVAARWVDGSWRDPQRVTDLDDGLDWLDVDLNARGQAILAWTRHRYWWRYTSRATVHAARLRLDGTWTDQQRVSSVDRQSQVGDVAIDRDGVARVVWDSIPRDHSDNRVIQISRDK